MITRSQMRRQLRAKGGIMNAVPRQNYGIGSWVKERIRKLIPNELADIAVKAAPFVAPFNPGIAAAMRGIGRFDQRGSISDALKQGVGTFAAGAGARYLGGQRGMSNITGGGLRGGLTNPLSAENVQKGKALFQGGEKEVGINSGRGGTSSSAEARRIANATNSTKPREGLKIVQKGVDFVKEKLPVLENLPDDVAQKLLVGGITAGASALYSYFTGAFEPQQPGETTGEYMARRNARVRQQMRGYMDNYYTPLRNPQYAAMSDEEKDNFIKGIVGQAGLEGTTDYQGMKKGGMPTGIMRANKAGVMERDYRDKGGFVPVGIKEKADDVPARLSKNEFVMTADAVRGAGNGDMNEGARRMYQTMDKLEAMA